VSAETPRLAVLERNVHIPSGKVSLTGELILPAGAEGVVVFAHGSGSSRHSPRNRRVARTLRAAGLGTLLFDLLTPEEEAADACAGRLRFDISLLATRLIDATAWLMRDVRRVAGALAGPPLRVGFFGASTGGAAALVAAARLGETVRAVVSRGGKPDLAGESLARVSAPTLLIVGGRDESVIELNERAFERMRCKKGLRAIPGATHLFEEPGALDEVAQFAADWFCEHLRVRPHVRPAAGTLGGTFARRA
jgi:dienelactone hydrolase